MKGDFRFEFFDTVLCCNFALTGLANADTGDEEIFISHEPRARLTQAGFETGFEWKTPDGEVLCRSSSNADQVLLHFPGKADFLVSNGNCITCYPQPDCPESMLQHLLLNQVVPRCLGAQGKLVVHASAVKTGPGDAAAAFIGHTGYGKSTLSTSFHFNGAELISDDGVLFKRSGTDVRVIGGLPGVRLLPDARQALFDDPSGFVPLTASAKKAQSLAVGEENGAGVREGELQAVFVLNDPVNNPENEAVAIDSLSGSDAVMAVLDSLFCLEPLQRTAMVGSFRNATSLVAGDLPFYRLAYPRSFDWLDRVRAAVRRVLE